MDNWPFENAHVAKVICVYCGKSDTSLENPLGPMRFGSGNDLIQLRDGTMAMVHKGCEVQAGNAFFNANFRPI